MLKEAFIGRVPTHFHVNPLVKAFIVSEMILWSSYNLFTPILGIFIATGIIGGSIERAAFGFSLYMVARVFTEIASGQLLIKQSEKRKFLFIIAGLLTLSLAYLLFAFSTTVSFVYVGYITMGVGLGIATPPRMALFSNHLDHNKEEEEWSFHDATSFIGMAIAGALGGFIAQFYGFSTVFLIASIFNILSVFPYLSFLRQEFKTN